MNKSFVISMVLVVAFSNGISAVSAEPSNAKIEFAIVKDVPAPATMTKSQFLLRLILDARADIRDRLEAVQELGDDLNASEIDSLLNFLKSRPNFEEKNIAGLRALKNNVINALKDQTVAPIGLTSTLIDTFHDHGQDFVMRDYAIQHLTTWYGHGALDSLDARERIQTTLKEALRENTSISGTALLGLHRLSLVNKGFNDPVVDQGALRLTISTETPLPARITAIQICAERHLTQALPDIERFAGERGQTALQLSAIAALGKLGNAQDIALLRKLQGEDDVALRPAIDEALKRLPWTLASQKLF